MPPRKRAASKAPDSTADTTAASSTSAELPDRPVTVVWRRDAGTVTPPGGRTLEWTENSWRRVDSHDTGQWISTVLGGDGVRVRQVDEKTADELAPLDAAPALAVPGPMVEQAEPADPAVPLLDAAGNDVSLKVDSTASVAPLLPVRTVDGPDVTQAPEVTRARPVTVPVDGPLTEQAQAD